MKANGTLTLLLDMPKNAEPESPGVEFPHTHEDGSPFTVEDYENFDEDEDAEDKEGPETIN